MKSAIHFLLFFLFSFFAFSNPSATETNPSLKKGLQLFKEQKFFPARDYLIKARAETSKENKFEETAKATSKLAETYLILDRKDSALIFLEENRKLILKNFRKENELLASCDDLMGDVYLDYGDADEAKIYFDESLQTRLKLYGENDSRTAFSYSSIAAFYNFHPGEGKDSAFYFAKRALLISRNFPTHNKDIQLEKIYAEYAYDYKISSRGSSLVEKNVRVTDTVIMYFDSALSILRAKQPEKTYFESYILHQIGNCFTDMTEWFPENSPITLSYFKKAEEYYGKDLTIRKGIFGNCHSDIAITNYTLALLYEFTFKKKKPWLSFMYQNRAIEALLPNFKFSNELQLPDTNSCINYYLLNVLLERRAIFMKQCNELAPSTELIIAMYQIHKLKIAIWDKIMTSFKSAEVSQVLALWNYDVFEDAITSAYKLFSVNKDSMLLDEMFSFAEQGKNAELMKYYFNASKSNYSVTPFRINSTISVYKIQSSLVAHEAVIEYVADRLFRKSPNFIFLITKDFFKVIPFETSAASDSVLNLYYQSIQSNEVRKFATLSYSIYNEILKPALAQLPKSITHLTIIPDKRFSHFSFDGLVTDTGNGFSSYRDLNYLCNHYTISYSLGATVNEILKKQKSTTTGTIVAFAPAFTSLASLPFSTAALLSLQQKTEGNYFFDSHASVQSFVQSAGKASVVHLATHAVADIQHPKESKIFFGDHEYLTLDSIYHLKLNSELVVVSACETAIGKELYAEGMKSFARAFTYAGCKSAVTTLWKVDDKATAEVLAKFYDYLLEGDAKDDALHKAKMDYLRNCKTSDEANPFYWSGIILTNDVSPIELKKKHSYVLALVLSVVVLVGGVGFWKKKYFTQRRSERGEIQKT